MLNIAVKKQDSLFTSVGRSHFMGKIIGIDLGTTNSVVAIMEGKDVKVIVNEEGALTTPSIVAYTKDGEVVVGQVAKRQAITNPENTIFSIKRFMGSKFDESGREIPRVPYKVVKADNGDAHVEIQGKRYSPPEISAKVLQKLKRAAEKYLGEEVTEAVITVPAYFNDAQRQATKDAGRIAGLDVKRIVNEPTAAALAYGMDKKKKEQIIAVYDFGGGTFDISVLEVSDTVVEVLATNGDTHLGGDDFDRRITEYLTAEFKKDTGIDVSRDKMVMQRLKEASEKAKIELSSASETDINLPFLTADASGPKHMNIKLSRAKFESLVADLVDLSFAAVKNCLKDAGKSANQIDEIVMVGGSIRVPLIQKRVEEFFGKKPNFSVNPDEVVAVGAAVQAGVLSGDVKELLLLDVTPLSLGIETQGGVMTVLIPRNTTIPTKKSDVFSTASDNQTSVQVVVFQGERPMARDNRKLGEFNLDGIPPSPRGVPQVEVTFDLDANGILNVSAKDKATNKEQTIRITNSSGLTENDIQRMVKEASEHESEDKRKKEEVEEKNKADSLCFQLERNLKDMREKLDKATAESIDAQIAKTKKAVDSGVFEDIKREREALEQLSHKMAEAMYQTQGPGAAAGATPPPQDPQASGQAKKDGVVDAEFEESH